MGQYEILTNSGKYYEVVEIFLCTKLTPMTLSVFLSLQEKKNSIFRPQKKLLKLGKFGLAGLPL